MDGWFLFETDLLTSLVMLIKWLAKHMDGLLYIWMVCYCKHIDGLLTDGCFVHLSMNFELF